MILHFFMNVFFFVFLLKDYYLIMVDQLDWVTWPLSVSYISNICSWVCLKLPPLYIYQMLSHLSCSGFPWNLDRHPTYSKLEMRLCLRQVYFYLYFFFSKPQNYHVPLCLLAFLVHAKLRTFFKKHSPNWMSVIFLWILLNSSPYPFIIIEK